MYDTLIYHPYLSQAAQYHGAPFDYTDKMQSHIERFHTRRDHFNTE